jgi:heat shock protein HslJ
MKYPLIILALSLLMTACSRQDSTFNKKIVGGWRTVMGDTVTFNTDGSFRGTELNVNPPRTNDYIGTWQISGGILTITPTSVSGRNPEVQVGYTVHFKIMDLDAHHLYYSIDEQTNMVLLYR